MLQGKRGDGRRRERENEGREGGREVGREAGRELGTLAPMAFPSASRACPLAAARAMMADASPLALFTCSILMASDAKILLCLRPSARLIADSRTPEGGTGTLSDPTALRPHGGGGGQGTH